MFKKILALVLGVLLGGGTILMVNPSKGEVPHKPLVAPGQYDKYYGFLSGGPGGDIRVIGVPSMRLLTRIPVFAPSMRYDYGVDTNGAPIGTFKEYTSGDTHHPVLSQTNDDYDGRWLFINDKESGQVARVNLKTFKTDSIVKLPNVEAAHGISIDPMSSRWLAICSEFIVPVPNNPNVDTKKYKALISILDPATMKLMFQIAAPSNQDGADFSKDGNTVFMTSYNTENALTEAAQIQKDNDAVLATNLPLAEKAVQEGKYTLINGVPVLDPDKISGLMTVIPVPKNPHGVNVTPDGKYAIANDKLSPTVSIIDTKTLKVVAEPYIGLGPLHTAFDGRGNAYTTNFIDSNVVKWNIEKAVKGDKDYIVDKITVSFSPGHTNAADSVTMHPDGDWLLSLNKLSKTRFLDVGPDLPENNQLIDISGDKMRLVYDAPADPEPHDAVIVPVSKINK